MQKRCMYAHALGVEHLQVSKLEEVLAAGAASSPGFDYSDKIV